MPDIFDIMVRDATKPMPKAEPRASIIDDIPLSFKAEYEMVHEPFDHQWTALKRSRNRTCYALFMEMGTGKTKVWIDEAVKLYREGKIDSIIVWAKKGCYRNWNNNEFPEHLPKDIQYRMTYWDAAAGRALQETYANFLKPWPGLTILTVNVEAMAYDKAYIYTKTFCKVHKAYGVVDESTSIKNPKAERTKALLDIRRYIPYRRIGTGSPVTNSPLDLFSQVAFLDPSLLGFTSFYAFRARYAEMVQVVLGSRSFKKIKGYHHIDELAEKLKTFSYRVLKKDCLDLPEKIYEYREVELTKEQATAYATMKKLAWAELEGKECSVSLALTKVLRLHQIVCGHLKDDEGTIHAIKNNRIDVLLDTIDEGSGKFIIFGTYVEDIKEIRRAIAEEYGPQSVVTYFGETPRHEREQAEHRFQTDPECRFFVTNKTGAYGLTLTAAETVIYYSNDYPLEVRIQGEDRAHRIGQRNNVTYIDLICRGTVDEKIIKALRNKKEIADLVTGDGWQEWIK